MASTPPVDLSGLIKFKALTRGRREARRQFALVREQLAEIQSIGRNHLLYIEWQGFSERYEKIERDMRENTNTCLSFLTAHRDALVPLVKSDISVKDKTETIEQFLKALQPFVENAEELQYTLGKLTDDVETFPDRVAEAVWAACPWYMKLWDSIKTCCTNLAKWLWEVVSRVDSCMADTTSLNEKMPLLPKLSSKPEAPIECVSLHAALQNLQSAWRRIEMPCKALCTSLQLAKMMEDPESCAMFIGNADHVSTQLQQYCQIFATD
ncbi:hypothetical protein POSPLADRAFT_1053043 [Postia placenta MAD-698-R-SB12]|uniref:Uncharacterized protein n=1 Tax=Postia placenta MAD-698-R-SB12 TaxID=670580 RepID=A0A1X6ND16_9APHY|nr:hypothetical protein POSPLADRAFT_1053043 [Postia placenta MAD-698-R-SB12]OSX66392.1 hypothetical protein POSPLADRAFT_1053043 [Postia placenta MAD-698-R-SB12]